MCLPALPRRRADERERRLEFNVGVAWHSSGSSGPVFHGLLFWLFRGCFKVSLGVAEWYRSSYGTDSENSEIASPVLHESSWSLHADISNSRYACVYVCTFLMCINIYIYTHIHNHTHMDPLGKRCRAFGTEIGSFPPSAAKLRAC